MSRLRNPRSTITALLTFFAVFLVVYLLLDSYFFFNITTTAKTLKQEQLAKIWYHFSFQNFKKISSGRIRSLERLGTQQIDGIVIDYNKLVVIKLG
jgi:hypothetical protein